jgi:hypothetical protein
VSFLSGRTGPFRADSVAQLHALGLPWVEARDLELKPWGRSADGALPDTGAFKARMLSAWCAEGLVGWFMTEGWRDIAVAREALAVLPCLLVEAPLEREGLPVPGGVPRIDPYR